MIELLGLALAGAFEGPCEALSTEDYLQFWATVGWSAEGLLDAAVKACGE